MEDVSRIEERWWKNCSTMLAERAANMVLRCSPTIRLPRALGGGMDSDEDDGGWKDGGVETEVDVSGVVVGGDAEPR